MNLVDIPGRLQYAYNTQLNQIKAGIMRYRVAGVTIMSIALSACTTACSKDTNFSGVASPLKACEVNTLDDARADILIIGDSISIGYTPYIQSTLEHQWDVSHNYCNARTSTNGVKHIDTWLNQRPDWYAITFNHGLHDAAANPANNLELYKSNLRIIAQKIKARTTRPLFILTTEVLPGTPGHEMWWVPALNQAASEVMIEEGIPIFDLNSVSRGIPHLHLNSTDVHYTEEGSQVLADAINKELLRLYGIM